ncbi:hypothetical protein HN358_00305 [Candidatus Uhrbacteria bacterium]|jgi:hypothetical protein|nr:hypothetical protein [Candidatus Uhrbacteria bacterium]MBT7717716.1 hypothetical protein [Candidatus Uhrbacteria bacterium]
MPQYVDVLQSAFVDLWAGVVLFVPKLLFAVIIFILGLILAGVLYKVVIRLAKVLHIDELMQKLELDTMFKRAGLKLDLGKSLGWLVKWFVIIFALIAAADILEWNQVTLFLTTIVEYIPNVLIAVIILLVGMILANFVQEIIKTALEAAKMHSACFLAGSARYAIIVFSFMAALVQLGIAESLIQVLFTGFVAMIALAGGLAFGLGGREYASRILNQLSKDLSSKTDNQ